MANAYQTKVDVINELRNQIYYNQQEIQRLLSVNTESHKSIVDSITKFLKENVIATSAIDLLESYLPTPVQKTDNPNNPVISDSAVKQID